MKKNTLHYKKSTATPVLPKIKTEWDLTLYYKNEHDPQIEKDIVASIDTYTSFAKKWRNKKFTSDANLLYKALTDYEALGSNTSLTRPARYFRLRAELNASDDTADKALALIRKRIRPAADQMLFFTLDLGKIPKATQKTFLSNPKLQHFKYFLEQIFKVSKHDLTEAEEKIIRLKAAQSSGMWMQMTDKLLSTSDVIWKGKSLPLPEAFVAIETLKSSDKPKLWKAIVNKIDTFGVVTEHEFNAIISDVRTEDDLRKYAKPYSATALTYQHDEKSIESFVESVSKKGFALSKKFYKLKASYHGVSSIHYSQKYDTIGDTPIISLAEALDVCRDVFYTVNPLYGKTFDEMLENGQIDVYPKKGKSGGAFMSSETGHPINVMLNHSDTMKSLETIAHEMGHAVHAARSSQNTPLYDGHTILTAETASTLFENLVFDALYERADSETKLVLLHDKLTGDIATVQRQIAFFNCELEIHNTIHSKGAMSHAELKDCMQKHLKSYLGDAVQIEQIDGASYIYVSHLRYGFYVYTYAFGHLVSSIMATNYKADPIYSEKIDTFLSAGQSASAVSIYKSIGLDITKPDVFTEALVAQEKCITEFGKLVQKKLKENK
jgi:oligoendopeptidase F